MSFHRILCPVDFSDASTHAAEHAAAVARPYDARVTILHVCPSVGRPPTLPVPDSGGAHGPSEAEIEDLRDRAVSVVAADAGIRVDVRVVRGHPVATIVEQARTLPADLIVMGTHGIGGVRHLILGSVTEKVLRQAPCPVMTVPPRAPAAPAQAIRRVLCATDLAGGSGKAEALAASLAAEMGAGLTLLHVLEWPWHEPPVPTAEGLPPDTARAINEYREFLAAGATGRLEQLASGVPDGVATELRVRFGKTYVELLDEASLGRADLIVMGVRGRNALDVSLFGSTTNHVVRHATCPVVTVPG